MPKQIPKLTAIRPIKDALGIDPSNEEKPYFTRCIIRWNGGRVEKNYRWNGGNIPVTMWGILRISKDEPRALLATMRHDHECEDEFTPQVTADANFVAMLGPIHFNDVLLPGVGWFRQLACYVGVRFYSLFVRPSTRVFFRRQ